MIGLLLPTRNKPEELERIIKEFEATSGNAILYFYVASDDPKENEYVSLINRLIVEQHPRVVAVQGIPLGFSRAINKLAELAFMNPEIQMVMRCEDDFYFVKPGWDEAYLSNIPSDGVGMIWCNYTLKDETAEPHTGAITRNWYRALGYFSLPPMRHYFCDNVLLELAKEIGRAIYIPDAYVDHRYVPSDPRKKDNFKETDVYGHDAENFRVWKDQGGLQADANKLRAVMK